MGGRPQTGPQQGIGGSKGSQVISYIQLEHMRNLLPAIIPLLSSKKVPAAPSPEFIPPDIKADAALGSKASFILESRVNLRNAVADGDADQIPAQFKYAAANCRIFYQFQDIYDYSVVWARVANVTWGGAQCISGSTSNSDDSIGTEATDTVPYSAKANTAIVLPAQPGLIPIDSSANPGNAGRRIEWSMWLLVAVGTLALRLI